MNYASVIDALKSVSTDNKDFLFTINSEGSPEEVFKSVESMVSALDADTDTSLITSAFEKACSDFKLKAADSAAESASELDGLWNTFNEISIAQEEIALSQQKGKLLQEQILDKLTSLSSIPKNENQALLHGLPRGLPRAGRRRVKRLTLSITWPTRDANLPVDKPLNLETTDLTNSDSSGSIFNWKFFVNDKPYDSQGPYRETVEVIKREVKITLLYLAATSAVVAVALFLLTP